MIHAYRLVYPISEHAPPQLWEWEQPYINNLIVNARTFDRWVVQWYFKDWTSLDCDNTRIWNTYYRPKPLFDHLPTWQEWLSEHRQLIIEVQEMVEEHTAQGRGRDLETFSHDLIPVIKQSRAITMGHREFPGIRSYEACYSSARARRR
jgi:hypothetical protein